MDNKSSAQQILANIENVAKDIAARMEALPLDSKERPLAVAVLATCQDEAAPMLMYMHTCSAMVDGKPDGYAQSLCMTRDLLLLCMCMDSDFNLGLSLIPAVLAQHPLMQHHLQRVEPTVVKNPDGTRTVTDLAEATVQAEGGVGGTQH